MIKIAVIEDDVTIRKNLKAFIGFFDDLELVSAHDSVESFLRNLFPKDNLPNVLLLDIGLPGISGLQGIPMIKEKFNDLDIIMLTTYEEEDKIVKAIQSGACSYLSKKTSLEKIIETIRLVHSGGSYMSPSIARKLATFMMNSSSKEAPSNYQFSPKQEEVIKGLVDGLSYKALAEKLGISSSTIKTHIKRIYKIMHVNSKAEAVAKYLKN